MSSVDVDLRAPVAVGPVCIAATPIHGVNRIATPKGAVFPVLHTPYDLYERF